MQRVAFSDMILYVYCIKGCRNDEQRMYYVVESWLRLTSKKETFLGGGEEPLMSEPMADPDHPVSQL